ncbi:protein HEXIM1 [Vicugna pacos]|uniref:Protein HEXIM1 n=1 Tax=Vicugna pacos TaxID=30538 RepID=A0ABM5BFT5_VICPA
MAEPLLSEYQHQPQTSNYTGAVAVHEEQNPDRPPGAEERVPEEDSRWQSRASPQSGGRPGQWGEGSLKPQPPPLQTQVCTESSCLKASEKGQNGDDLSAGGVPQPAAGGEQRPQAVEPLLSEYQYQPQTSNCTGAVAVHEEQNLDHPPGAEERVPDKDSRWQSRASPQSVGRPGQWGEGSLEFQPPSLQTQVCPESSCPEAGEKGQNGDDMSAGGAPPPAAGGEQRSEAEPLVQPCHDSETNKLGASAARGEAAWRQQQRQLGKKKHRRRRTSKKKRLWKPYYELTWEERRKFDERQSLRASRIRAEMFAKGQPVAPYNTTQFLMDDHDQEEPDLKTGLYPKRAAAKSDDTSDEDFMEEAAEEDGGSDGMGGDGSEFLQRDFSETYERYHAESLQNMSKQELIKEYLELEKCLSRMEDENNRLRLESKRLDGDDARVRELELELERLRAENLQLLTENELHRQQERAPLSKFGD